MSNHDILATLSKRREKIAAHYKAKLGNSAAAIEQTLMALDHPVSYYVVLTHEERELVRAEWQALALNQGVSLSRPKTKPVRKPPVIPASVLEFFGDGQCIPNRPRAADDFRFGTRLTSWMEAQTRRSIQLNPPGMTYWLIFDCDHTDIERWQTAGLPEPSFITVNPANGHHHVVYRLGAPVCTSERGRYRPIAYLRAIRGALRAALGADENYAGLLTKNPLHPAWQVIRPCTMPAYTLAELAGQLDLKGAGGDSTGVIDLTLVEEGGRNRALFDAVRVWAYSHSEDEQNILTYADHCNAQLRDPLYEQEVRTIAKSIYRYCCNRLAHKQGSSDEFRARQATRGRLGGRPCTTGTERPWEVEGISRATWYRRRAKEMHV